LSTQDQANLEREIWGGISTDPKKVCKSAVYIRIKKTNANNNSTKFEEKNNQIWQHTPKFKGKTGIAYGLFSAAHDKANNVGTLLVEKEWKIKITVKNEYLDQIRETINYWGTFGGLGSRSRRGFGSIRICNQKLVNNENEKRLEIYTFGEEFNNAFDALNSALIKYKSFRQEFSESGLTHGSGRKKRTETDETLRGSGRSNWPEADLIRRSKDQWFGKQTPKQHQFKDTSTTPTTYKDTGTPHAHEPIYTGLAIYPRASFGLPIVIHFIDYNSKDIQNSDPSDTTIIPADHDSDRLASPIIFRPIQIGDGKFQMGLIILPGARKKFRCKISNISDENFIGFSQSASSDHLNKKAWITPIDYLIEVLNCKKSTLRPADFDPPQIPFYGDDWGRLYVKYRNQTTTFTAEKEDKTATAAQENGKKLYKNLSQKSKEKLKSGGCHFRVIVDEKSIIDLIEDQK
jgi:CRISPR-associated protein Cmr1